MITAISLIIALLSVGFVFYPLFRMHFRTFTNVNDPLEDLLAERDNLYTTIKDLEFDHLAGKLDEDDYESLRSQYEADAIQVLHHLDAWQETRPPLETTEQEQDLVEAEIEKYLQRRKQSQ